MSIKLVRTSDGYHVSVTPSPHIPAEWSSDGALSQQAAIDRLVEIGYHLQDVADALHFADEDWHRRAP